jgi:hypothetical protein
VEFEHEFAALGVLGAASSGGRPMNPTRSGGTVGPVSVGPVTSPPGTIDVCDRSTDKPFVTIQTAATNTAIPTTLAAMRWFRRFRSRRRSIRS